MDVVYASVLSPVYVDGHVVVAGQHWPADDPIVKQYPQYFSEDARYGLCASAPIPEDAPLEQATAAPGEKRTTRAR